MSTSREELLSKLRTTSRDIAPNQSFEVDDFRPQDAQGVANLYYTVYGESFAIDHVYDPEAIIRLNASQDQHQVVGRTRTGDIIGLYALFRNPPGRRIMEGGSWIVHPAYRNSSLALKMALKIHLHPPADLDLDIIFGQSVCDHVMTQKLGRTIHATSCALESDAMSPRPEGSWERGSEDLHERISLLNQFCLLRDNPHTIFPPKRYQDFLTEFYAVHNRQRTILEESSMAERTECTVTALESASLVRMTVQVPGRDFSVHLADVMERFSGYHVRQIVLSLAQPGCSHAVETARTQGFHLGGILPQWFDSDGFLLQRIAGTPDFSRIKLFEEDSRKLLERIVADWAAVRRKEEQ